MKTGSLSLLTLLVFCTTAAWAKVHKFSPEFQAVYDAATTPERPRLSFELWMMRERQSQTLSLTEHGRMTIHERRGRKLLLRMIKACLSQRAKSGGDSRAIYGKTVIILPVRA